VKRSVFYNVVAPKWRAPGRPAPGLGTRPLLRWQVVKETRPVVHPSGVVSSAYEHISFHWTLTTARRMARLCQALHRFGGETS
jgi:hypothetical protein